ncbi:MAG TPA: PspC domain-containing protein [Candidatus Limnocylindrales bacterium]|nr:PspC domain-containing protein [Candidatus Limnocylindrales bacterium]
MTTYHEQASDPDGGGTADEPSWEDRRPPTPPGYGADFEPRRLYRSTTDRVWAGVCGGLAEHFGWDPSVTRVGYSILTIFTGIFPMLILYVVMAMVVPNGPLPGARPLAGQPNGGEPGFGPSAYQARSSAPGAGAIVLGVLLIAGGGLALLNRYFFIDWRDIGPLLVIGLGVVVIGLAASRRT